MMTLILAILLFISSPSYAMEMIGFGAAAGGCATQSTDQSFTSANSAAGMNGDLTLGQSITAGITGSVYSITVRGLGWVGGAGQLVARFGTTANLSSSYLGETIAQDIIFDEDTHTYELLFPEGSRPSQTSSGTYYITVINTGQDTEDVFDLLIHDTGTYAGGVHYQGGVTPHDMTDGEVTGYDMRFITKVCD